jgi:hypothetical protein
MVLGTAGAAQRPKIGDFWPAQKTCITNPNVVRGRGGDGRARIGDFVPMATARVVGEAFAITVVATATATVTVKDMPVITPRPIPTPHPGVFSLNFRFLGGCRPPDPPQPPLLPRGEGGVAGGLGGGSPTGI